MESCPSGRRCSTRNLQILLECSLANFQVISKFFPIKYGLKVPSYLSSYLSFFQGVNEEGILRRRIEAVITGQTRNLLALFIGLVGSNPTVSAIEGSLAKLGFVRLFSLFGIEECCTSTHIQSCQHCFCRRYF